jgi:hypothetical protein
VRGLQELETSALKEMQGIHIIVFLVLGNRLRFRNLLDHSCRRSHGHRECWNTLCDNRACSDSAAVANRDTGQDTNIASNPAVVTYEHWQRKLDTIAA